MPQSISQIKDLLLPGVKKLTGDYKKLPTQWSQVFKKETSNMTVERKVEMRYLQPAALKAEGAATRFDNKAGQRFVYNQEHVEIGLGYAVTRKAIDDNLYKSQFNPSNLGLMDSFAEFDEIRGANILNTATTYDPTIGGDGVSLCNTSHPIDTGLVANRPATDLDLNENAIYSQIQLARRFRNQAGLKRVAFGRQLIVGVEQEYIACRLLKSELRPGTANNDVNAGLLTGGETGGAALPDGYMVMDYLTEGVSNWFILTNQPTLIYMDRVPFETDMHTDAQTGNLLVVGYARNSFAYEGWRGIVGSFPS